MRRILFRLDCSTHRFSWIFLGSFVNKFECLYLFFKSWKKFYPKYRHKNGSHHHYQEVDGRLWNTTGHFLIARFQSNIPVITWLTKEYCEIWCGCCGSQKHDWIGLLLFLKYLMQWKIQAVCFSQMNVKLITRRWHHFICSVSSILWSAYRLSLKL